MKIRNKSRNLWLVYEVVMVLLIFGFVLFVYLEHIFYKTWLRNLTIPFSYTGFQGQFFSFFTIQSNIIVGTWFLLAAIFHFKSDDERIFIVKQNGLITVSIYITVTFLTYVILMLPFSAKTMSLMNWIENVGLHIFIPILTLIYTWFNIGKKTIDIKKYLQRNLLVNLIYPLFYFIYVVLRLAMALLDGKSTELYFPYLPKINTESWILVLLVSLGALFILGIFLASNVAFCYLNNYLFKRNQKYHH